ncbi:hypothetical protein J7T55_013125 [Diaporthe amygdali]|uniref:uncharacterized protein n=1 Tax=Phomopsis amygdali TaxID=1214568 RepID=UPI0022FF166A|nr:uncharacterized protein J7T55_013125 [Diaporthe amygdali]KAJ0118869.1 hypothetical protein J7T55_013125 [Diaporthe amygdali]
MPLANPTETAGGQGATGPRGEKSVIFNSTCIHVADPASIVRRRIIRADLSHFIVTTLTLLAPSESVKGTGLTYNEGTKLE